MLLFTDSWKNCNEHIKKMVIEQIILEKMIDETLDIEDEPKGILLFDYDDDLEGLKEEYLKDHPKVKKCIVKYIKFLPEELWYLIENKQLFSYNMFSIIIVF